MKYCWCTIQVRDLEQSLKFYQNILNLRLNRRFTSPDGSVIAFLSDGESADVELIYSEKSTKYEGKGISLGFKVPDLDAALAEVKAKGIADIKGPFKVGGGTQFFYIKDPDDLDIQIVQPGF